MSAFVKADIEAIESFETISAEAIQEFADIQQKFRDINSDLLNTWEGDGADAYKKETDHILENIGGIKDVLDSINSSVIKDIKDNYNKLDEDLAEFNRNPPSEGINQGAVLRLTREARILPWFSARITDFPAKPNSREGFGPPGERKNDRRHTNLLLPGEVCVTAGAVQEKS